MPKIDLRTFLDDDNVLIVCKSVNGKGSKPPIWTHTNKLFEIPKIRVNMPSYSDNRI